MPMSDKSNRMPLVKYLHFRAHDLPKSVMDLGCGYGNIGTIVKTEFPFIKVYGKDIFDKNVTRALNRTTPDLISVYERVTKCNIYEDLNDRDKFDLFIAFDVLEHFVRREAMEIINYYRVSFW